MADPDYVSASNTTYGSNTNTTVTAPATISNGNKLIIVGLTVANPTAPTATPPAGFAEVAGTWPIVVSDGASQMRVWVWYKVAASESGNYTFTHAVCNSQGFMLNISGGVDTQPSASLNSGIGVTTTFSGLTTVNNNALVIVLGTDWGDTAANLTAPAGTTPTFTERLDVAPLIYAATGILATAGATGDKTMTNNTAAGNPWTGTMVVIEPTLIAGGVYDYTRFPKQKPVRI